MTPSPYACDFSVRGRHGVLAVPVKMWRCVQRTCLQRLSGPTGLQGAPADQPSSQRIPAFVSNACLLHGTARRLCATPFVGRRAAARRRKREIFHVGGSKRNAPTIQRCRARGAPAWLDTATRGAARGCGPRAPYVSHSVSAARRERERDRGTSAAMRRRHDLAQRVRCYNGANANSWLGRRQDVVVDQPRVQRFVRFARLWRCGARRHPTRLEPCCRESAQPACRPCAT